MGYAVYVLPLAALALLTFWVVMICKALREEHDYVWVVLLVVLPPLGLPLYLVNFYILGDKARGLTAIRVRNRREREAEVLELEFRTSHIPALQERLCELYFTGEKWEKCLEHLKPALDRDPDNLRLQYLAARTLLALNRQDAAIQHLAFIVETDQRYDAWKAMLLLAQVLEVQGRRDEALQYYDRLARNVTFPEALYHHALAYWDSERREEVRETLQKMIASYDADPGGHPAADRHWVEEARKLVKR
jgi:tetratricopeptide (TPR) repeat protein